MRRIFLLGYPISHSLSPFMHNAALHAVGLDEWRYELLETANGSLPQAVARLRANDCIGANVTIPYKQTIVRWLDGLGESARDICAVNTIVKCNGQLIGENTDACGFMQALRDAQVDPHGIHAVILGAGGAARAVAFALGRAGARSITILNRTPSRAKELADDLNQHLPELTVALSQACDARLVVNAVPPTVPFDIGMLRLSRGVVAFDLAYRPAETSFMRQAIAAGARAVNGLSMLVYQAAAALELWTGREVPAAVMFDAAQRAMQ